MSRGGPSSSWTVLETVRLFSALGGSSGIRCLFENFTEFLLVVLGKGRLQNCAGAREVLQTFQHLVARRLAHQHKDRSATRLQLAPQLLHEIVIYSNVPQISRQRSRARPKCKSKE